MQLPATVKLIEVGPRDGLQHENSLVCVETKIEFINRLSATGLPVIEVGSFVSPKWVPQMAKTRDVFQGIQQKKGVSYPILVPNQKGLDRALEAGVKEIAIFTAACDTFNQKNTNCSIKESLNRLSQVTTQAHANKLPVRAYISCVLGSPYSGPVTPMQVYEVASQLHELGCYELSLGDTIGVGTANQVEDLLNHLTKKMTVNQLAVHFHDTYGQALANILTALQAGVTCIDTAVAGLGGCPYAPGASGNVATEKVLYLLNGLGIQTGVNFEKLLNASKFICNALNRTAAIPSGNDCS